uniref:Uncharacterized protein n=1 Tax=Onchocerca volvulus TaxID=6282 RepID=A0A8R1XTF1_ONCVO
MRQKRAWSCGSTKEATTSATTNSNVTSSYFISRVRPKLKPWCRVIPSGPVDRQTTLEKRYFERPSSEKQIRNRTQDISFSFKVPNICCKKGKLIVNSMKKTYSLKPPIRTTVRSTNASELLEKAVLGTTKTVVTSKLPSGDISTQGLSSGNSNTHKYILESTLLSSPKKGELEDQTDEEPPTKLKKEMHTEEKVLLMGGTNSSTPSLTEANSNDKIAGHGKKCFPRVVCSSRPSAILNRSSDWEKLAMKSRSIFLKQRSQKMLKDRLEKYCVTRRKSHMSNSERLDAKRASQTPTVPPLTVPPAPPSAAAKFNQNFFDLCWNNFKKRIEQSKTACAGNENKTLAEKSMLLKVDSSHGISEFDLQDAKKISFFTRTKILPLTAINRSSRKIMSNRSDAKDLSLIGDTKDAAEKEVKKEVESLVERAQLQTAANSHFRTSQDSRKSASGNIQEGCAFGMTDDGAKLKKMWALVAEETSLTNSLNDINAKINKVKADLCTLSSKSFQITKRLDEVRLLKSQLLNNSHDTVVRQ